MADERPAHILVVDDTEGNRYATSRILRSAGFDVREADSGATALAAMSDRPDLVVLDVNLPDMTGFQVVERMRGVTDLVTVPVLHLSASYTTNADRARGLNQGADAYLTHPIDPTVFVATVRALLRTSVADRRLASAAREWQATFDALGDSVILLDDDARVQRANRTACALLGCEPRDVAGQALAPLLARAFGESAGPLAERMVHGARFDKTLVAIGPRTLSVTTDQLPAADDHGPQTVCVLEDVTERIAAEREREDLLLVAESARREAEAANHAKSEFLAMMSHELRTPLNAIGGYAELLELGIRGPVTDQQRADLDRIKRSQTYLLSLINDVLNFAKIESGHLHVELDDVRLRDVVQGMSDFVQPQLRERGLSFTCDACPPELRVRAEADKVQQILLNLLSNALKFTPAGGSISLRCTASGQGALVVVQDTGVGIAPEKQERIFEPFVQVDRRYKREQEGIGLGLAISRELARAMGGELTVRSVEGQGSTFELRLRGASEAPQTFPSPGV